MKRQNKDCLRPGRPWRAREKVIIRRDSKGRTDEEVKERLAGEQII